MNHLSLTDRVLWEDGTISVPSDMITKYIQFAEDGKLFTDVITPEIAEYNKLYSGESTIRIKKKSKPLSTDWIIPAEITSIDIEKHLEEKLAEEIESGNFTSEQIDERVSRLFAEYDMLVEHGLTELIYAILYMINRFEANNIVWGVGRGSSVSSYLLYILGIHDVDSIEYDLDFTEFLH